MSLTCTETGNGIRHGARLYVGEAHDGGFCCAISAEVYDRIPRELQRARPCEALADGLNIFIGISDGEPTFRGFYQWSTLKKGDFVFSVSGQTAAEYLPRMWAEYQPGAVPTPPSVHIKIETAGPPTGQPN